jgi:hypothetical protein
MGLWLSLSQFVLPTRYFRASITVVNRAALVSFSKISLSLQETIKTTRKLHYRSYICILILISSIMRLIVLKA